MKYAKKSNIVAAKMDHDIVMLDIVEGKYYNIGGCGGAIWQAIEKPMSKSEIVKMLMSEYDVDEVSCNQDVEEFLEELQKRGLLIVEGEDE